jgi:hypothetical protein
MDFDQFDFNKISDDLNIMQKYINNLPDINYDDEQYEIEMRFSGNIVNRYNINRIINKYNDWEEEIYDEERYEHLSNQNIKIRTRKYEDKIETSSKIKIYNNKYINHWMKLCLSMECIGDFQPFGIVKTMNSYHTIQYKKYVTKNIIIDIKIFDNKTYPSIEVELTDFQDISEFVRTCKTILDDLQCIDLGSLYMSTRIYNNYQELIYTMCPDINIQNNMYPKPVTLLNINNILKKKFYVTSKSDGERCWLLGTYDNKLLEINTHGRIIMLNHHLLSLRSKYFLLDCEKVSNNYILLDILFIDTMKLYDLPFHERKDKFKIISDKLNIPTKEYWLVNDKATISKCWKSISKSSQDGLIFIEDGSYMSSNIFKWKYNNTVDLLFKDNQLWTADNKVIDYYTDVTKLKDNYIYEFKLEESVLHMVKERFDKKFPNKYNVVLANFKALDFNIINTFTSKCYRMRQYHNNIKRTILTNLSKHYKILLDIGSGQGGDINKWAKFSKVYCVEPDPGMREELSRRIAEKGEHNRITVINTKLSEFSENIIYDTVTLFFCINLFNKEDFNKLSDIIKNTCLVTIIFMDGGLVKKTFNNFFSCSDYKIQISDNYVVLDIPETFVKNIKENYVSLHMINLFMSQNNFKCITNMILDKGDMSSNELKLSSCYRVVTFKK